MSSCYWTRSNWCGGKYDYENTDSAFGAHRSHSHYLALNEDTYSLFAEVLEKSDGCSNGMGGSMHIVDNKVGFRGSVPIVGATIPIATGAAYLQNLKRTVLQLAISEMEHARRVFFMSH